MKGSKISSITGSQIFDSRGVPTVKAEVILECGAKASAAVPSGASTGKHEAIELRDKNMNEFQGKGVSKAVSNINSKINKLLCGMDISNQAEIDSAMLKEDGTKNKGVLGANATLAVSLACAKAGAAFLGVDLYRYIGGINAVTLPIPMMNILNGGAHAGNNIEIQEFMIFPCGAGSFSEAMRIGTEIYHSLKAILKSKGLSTAVGDEGGFAPDLEKDEQALELIMEAISKSGYKPYEDVRICLDIAAGEWSDENGGYIFPKKGEKVSSDQLLSYYQNLANNYPIVSIEDPFSDDDFENFTVISSKLGDKIQIVGDDLFVTNMDRLKEGIKKKSANAILIKPNQIGTLTETLGAIEMAFQNGYRTIISHRSGETEDTSISDIAVATNSGQIKTGAPARSERVCKYNRLLEIEEKLGCAAQFGTQSYK